MKIILLILLALIISTPTLKAEKLTGQAKLDSLLAELPNAKGDTNLIANVKLSNMEYFSIGDKNTYFKVIIPDEIKIENGQNIIWDYLEFYVNADNVVNQEIFNAKDSDYSSIFPDAQIYEQFGQNLIFLSNDDEKGISYGTLSLGDGFSRPLKTPLKSFVRPMSYGMELTDSVGVEYSNQGYSYKGYTIQNVVCDGEGELKLPNKTYKNVLKFTITQNSVDVMQGSGSKINVTGITTVWFDAEHNTALMKVDKVEIRSQYYNDDSYSVHILK